MRAAAENSLIKAAAAASSVALLAITLAMSKLERPWPCSNNAMELSYEVGGRNGQPSCNNWPTDGSSAGCIAPTGEPESAGRGIAEKSLSEAAAELAAATGG